MPTKATFRQICCRDLGQPGTIQLGQRAFGPQEGHDDHVPIGKVMQGIFFAKLALEREIVDLPPQAGRFCGLRQGNRESCNETDSQQFSHDRTFKNPASKAKLAAERGDEGYTDNSQFAGQTPIFG